MRWLFLFVLSLNLAYVGLEISRSSSGGSEDVPALKNVQTIVLLSELASPSEALQLEPVEKSEEMSAEVVEHQSTGAEPVAAVTGQVVEQASDSAPVAADSQQKEEAPEVVASPAEEPEPAENVEAEEVVRAGQKEVPAKSAALVTQQSASCFTVGPFRDLGKLRGLTREIKSYVVKADFRGQEEKEPKLYWVYLKPEKNRAQAIKTGKRLKAKKIKDFYVIREGEKINGLSLGYFRNRQSAYRLAKKVKNFGFDVVVEQVFRTYTIYWLDYQLAAGVSIPESVFEKYTGSGEKEKITRQSRDCDD